MRGLGSSPAPGKAVPIWKKRAIAEIKLIAIDLPLSLLRQITAGVRSLQPDLALDADCPQESLIVAHRDQRAVEPCQRGLQHFDR